jgi:hypothetical protein
MKLKLLIASIAAVYQKKVFAGAGVSSADIYSPTTTHANGGAEKV